MVSFGILSLIFVTCLSGPSLEEPLNSGPLSDTDGSWEFLGASGYSGYITMNALTSSSLFYWLFEAINSNITTDTKPLIIWLQGGPGCSGSFGMLWEAISPIQVNLNSQPLRTNTNHTWATSYHLMSVDFPYGAGYSFANSAGDQKNTTQSATYYLYRFFYKLWQKYPAWFTNREVFVWGESYGGHWVPGLAWNILQQNALKNGFNFPLKGIAIGDPWIDPATQSQTYSSYAYTNSLINSNQMSISNYYQNLVSSNLNSGQLLQAEANWDNTVGVISNFAGGVNVYNVREFGTYNENYLSSFMNKASTKEMLHVGSATWVSCNDTVYDYYRQDIMNSSIVYLPYILSQGVTVMIYNGQDDLIVNTPGIENMMASINWPGAAGFASAPKLNWVVEGNMAGYVQTYQNLTFVLVLASGHMAPFDQPVNIKNMVERYVNGTGWN